MRDRLSAVSLPNYEHLQEVSAQLPCVVFVAEHSQSFEATPRYTFVGDNARQIFGVESLEVFESFESRAVHPDDLDWVSRKREKAALRLQSWRAEFRVRVAGIVRWLEGHARFHRTDGGRLRECGYWADITARKLLEVEASAVSCARFSVIFQASPYAALIADRDDRVVAVNAAWITQLGYLQEEIPTIGACFERLFPNPAYRQTILDEWLASVGSAAEHAQRAAIIAKIRCKDGRERFIEGRSSTANGETILTVNDISERVRAEIAQRKAIEEHAELLRQLRLQSKSLPLGLVVADASEELVLRDWNPAAERIFGYGRAELIDKPLRCVAVPPELLARIRENDGTAKETTRALSHHTTPDGRAIDCEWIITVLPDLVGQPARVMAMVQDVTERLASEQRHRMWTHVIEHSPEAIFICDAQERILMVNPAFQNITGFSAAEAIGKTPRILSSGRQRVEFYVELWKKLKVTGKWQGEIWNRRKSGETYVEWLSISAVYGEDGTVAQYVGIFSDITERKATEDRVAHLAHYDVLTELPNRSLLHDRLGQAIKSAERHQRKVACIFVDLDRFKAVNDSLGHDVGDMLLQAVASRLSASIRAEDTVARMGGDEFVVVLPELLDAKHAATVVDKLLHALAPSVHLEGHDITVTASMGISVFPDDARDVHGLLRNADAAMYEAKAAGRNVYRFYTSDMNQRVRDALFIENSLRRALVRDEFELHYQPQFEIATGELIGVEALIRWRAPDRGLVPPGVFIPIAEERGLITALGQWVIEEATRQLATWSTTPLRGLAVAINVSSIQIHQPDFVQCVAQAIAASGIEPRLLEIELTESTVMRDAESTIKVIERLHALGLKLSIDDFGTGYSSLSYLRRFPIDKIKIDQSFVRELASDEATANIVSGIVGLARNLKLEVVAEGVETEQQLQLLGERGCHQAQGFLFSRALPAAELEAFVREHRNGPGARPSTRPVRR